MSKVSLQGEPLNIDGHFPQAGEKAPNFQLCAGDLSDLSLSDFQGKKLVLNIFPSIDTPTCATSVREFNAKAASFENTIVLCISADLPFAQGRFCEVEGLKRVQAASFFRSPHFTQDYGVNITTGALKGLAARAVVVLNETGQVVYSELVKEIADEPNYSAAIAAL